MRARSTAQPSPAAAQALGRGAASRATQGLTHRASSQSLWHSSEIFLGDLDASRRLWTGREPRCLHTMRSFFRAAPCL